MDKVCKHCGKAIMQSPNPNDIKWYHRHDGCVPCEQQFAMPTGSESESAPTAEVDEIDWALRDLADGWIASNEREGFYANARNVIQRILAASPDALPQADYNFAFDANCFYCRNKYHHAKPDHEAAVREYAGKAEAQKNQGK